MNLRAVPFLLAFTLSAATTSASDAQEPTLRVTWGGYVDAYYAYDLGRPPTRDRAFTTQPARANEFNVNLAFLEAKLSGDGLRGRVALQAGTSVQANYSAEPTMGAVSGASLARHLQEAYVGLRLSPTLWVDAGIFFSNVGVEGWIPSDNLTLTRSLTADFSPYYSSGLRATWHATPRTVLRLDLVNGWQNISETNSDKALGTRLDVTIREGLVATQYTFVGNETGQLRLFAGVGLSGAVTPRWSVAANVDVGQQDGVAGADATQWVGGSAMLRRSLTTRTALVLRGEWYSDPDHTIIATGAGQPAFRAAGLSVGLDVAPRPGASWRNEVRLLSSPEAVFPDRGATSGLGTRNVVLTSALALRF